MIIPLNWLTDYLALDKSAQDIANSFTSLGLMQEKPIQDNILELEHRMDRADWLSIIGCARDLSAFENIKLKLPKIKLYHPKPVSTSDKIKIKVDTPTVRRYKTRIFKNIQVKPSPQWLVDRLEAYGIPSKNNLVDITNFVMVEFGQPMHAQDIATLPQKQLHLRNTHLNEEITTLLGTKLKLPQDTFVISSGKTMCVIGGIVGGNLTGVTSQTTDIILDAGNYDQRVIRATSRKLKIQNETVSRYDKYLDPRLIDMALDRATDLILQLAGGEVYENGDYYPQPVMPITKTLTLKRLQLISGLNLSLKTAKTILTALGYIVTEESAQQITLEIPLWRTDIDVEDDLIADILRISNYDTLPTQPLTTPIPTNITPSIYTFETKLRQHLLSLTAHEHITIPLVKDDGASQRVKLANSLSTEQNALRLTLTETLLPILRNYQKHQRQNALIFEIANSFQLNSQQQPTEIRELAVASLQDIRPILKSLMNLLNLNYQLIPQTDKQVKVVSNQHTLGTLSLHHFTLSTVLLNQLHQPYSGLITQHTHSTSIDLSLKLPPKLSFYKISQLLHQADNTLQSIKVIENSPQNNSLLIRLFWEKLNNPTQTRLSLVKALKKLKITSRSN